MRYWKATGNGYILSIGTGGSGAGEITAEEYNTIYETIANKPTPPDGYNYKLREDLTWEQCESPVKEPNFNILDSKAPDIIVGGINA